MTAKLPNSAATMQIDYPVLLLQSELASGLQLVQALHHPDLSRLGKKTAVRALLESVKTVVSKSSARDIAQTLPSDQFEVVRHTLKVKPARASLAWPQALELELWALQFPVRGPGWCAYYPALDFTAVAATLEQLSEVAPQQLRATLEREGYLRSLEALLPLQHQGMLQASWSQVRLTPASGTDSEAQESTLEKVASALPGRGGLQPAWERDDEVRRLAAELAAGRSVLLCGPSGVGKSATFREMVRRREELQFAATPFYETSGSRLMAGQIAFGAWQARCQKVLAEAERKKAILHLGNLWELSQTARHSTDPLGMAGFFRPYLESGQLVAVSECTPQQFELLEKEQPQLLQAFTVLNLDPLDARACARVLRRAAPSMETEARDELLHLHARWTDPGNWPGRPLRFLRNLLVQEEEADRDLVLTTFSQHTGLPLLFLDDRRRLSGDALRDWFRSRVRSQEAAVERVVERLLSVKAGLNRPGRPIATLLLLGPTGTGKTELARTLAEYLFSDRQKLTRLDMSEYSSSFAVTSLIGWPGSEKPGVLTQKIREAPFQVLLFDEVEKAHPDFFDLLLQILGEGRLTDNQGQTADFGSCLVLMTSNLGAETFVKGSLGFRSTAPQGNFLEAVRAAFRPELLNRIDELVPFGPLPSETIQELAARELERLQLRVAAGRSRVSWEIEPGVIAELARRGYDPRYGARPLKRSLDRCLLAPLAEQLLRYPSETPLGVHVSDRLEVQVRSQAELREARAQHERMRVAGERVAELRRKLHKVGKGPLLTDLQNEQARFRRLHRKKPGMVFPQQALLQRYSELRDQGQQLEEEALLLLAQPENAAGLGRECDRLTEDLRLYLRALYTNSFPEPDTALVALFSDSPAALWLVARAYGSLGAEPGKVRWLRVSVLKGASSLPEEDNPTPHLRREWLEHPEREPAALGLIGEFRGAGLFPLLQDESGVHVVRWEHNTNTVWVEVTQSPAESEDPDRPWKAPAYSPPAEIHRRGFWDNVPRLRTYHLPDQHIEDPRQQRVYPWTGPELQLDRLLSDWLDRRAEMAALP